MSMSTTLAAAIPALPVITIPAPTGTRQVAISSRLLDDVAVTTVSGVLDRDGAGRLIALLEALQAGGTTRMLVDLSDADTDPAVVAGLASVGRRCTRRGGWLIVDGAPSVDDGAERDLDLPLDRLFTIYLQSRPV